MRHERKKGCLRQLDGQELSPVASARRVGKESHPDVAVGWFEHVGVVPGTFLPGVHDRFHGDLARSNVLADVFVTEIGAERTVAGTFSAWVDMIEELSCPKVAHVGINHRFEPPGVDEWVQAIVDTVSIQSVEHGPVGRRGRLPNLNTERFRRRTQYFSLSCIARG